MKRILTYFILSFALLFNGVLPAYSSVPTFSEEDKAALKELYGGDAKVLICTSFGFKYVSLDELEKEQGQGETSPQEHCPLCLLTANKNKSYEPSLETSSIEVELDSESCDFVIEDFCGNNQLSQIHKNSRAPPQFS